jgi:starch-binding outer membrane protein, SusD/RagB family
MKALLRHRLLIGPALLTLVGGISYSCKDFLDTPAQGTLEAPDLVSLQGVEGMLVAAYRALDWNNGVGGAWGNAASNWVWGSVPSDDAYKGSEASDQPGITDIELYNWTTGQAGSYLNDKWRGTYEGVVRSNTMLRLLRRVLAEKPGEISPSAANGIRGEALFLRAHYHFEAWKMWRNIPYYFEDDTTDFRKPNNLGGDAVVTLILNDLDAAIALLPLTPRNGDKGRATQWTAKAYKGRVQVYAGLFADALITLRDVRTNGPYALEASFDRVWTGFADLVNGKETIFAFQASVNDGEPDGNNGNYGERLNFPHGGSTLETCCGFHQPSQNLVNFFAVDAVGLPLALTDANWNARDAELDGSATVPVDPRLDWTVGRDRVPYKDWGLHDSTWIRATSYGGPYSPKKNVHERTSGAQSKVGWLPAQLNSVKMHLYRYADLLLLLAEAEVEAGILENARTIVNEIRARAGATAQGPGTIGTTGVRDSIALPLSRAGDIFSLTKPWAVYRVGLYSTPFADQAAARTAVQYERRLELAMEGHRFFDLRRWGIFEQVLNAYLAEEETRRTYLMGAAQVTPRYSLYPIPQLQIELSQVGGQDRLQQNFGW